MAGGDKEREEGEEKTRQWMRREEPCKTENRDQDGKMKDEDWFSYKPPKAPLLTMFLSEDVRTLLR